MLEPVTLEAVATQTGDWQRWPVARGDEIPPGGRKLVEIDGRSIGIFNVNGQWRAVLNLCPHALAPICRGHLRGTTLVSAPGEFAWAREGEILACPWHGWEFDLISGACLVDKRKLRFFPVEEQDNTLYVVLRATRAAAE